MACKDHRDTWTVIGINSFTYADCTQSVVARVSTYVDWIQQNMNLYG